MTLLALWLTTFGVCVLGAVVPIVNTEIYLVSVSALSPRAFVGPLVLAATFGQMTGKVAMFYAARGMVRIRSERVRRTVDALRVRLEARPRTARLLLLSSATLGLPPLYAMTVACGAVGMGIASFFLIGSLGRFVHFLVVALLPQYAKLLLA